MNTFTPILDADSGKALYLQLYESIRREISTGRLAKGTRLPSLRALASSLKISITTVSLAYNQLLVEGYITSREKSGYFVDVTGEKIPAAVYSAPVIRSMKTPEEKAVPRYTDPALFDFVKWKKCLNHVFNEQAELLTLEADPQGEEALRTQICTYLYMTRGVVCTPEQIVIAAGTQSIIGIACSILSEMGMKAAAYEDPGYLPAVSVFRDRGFELKPVSITENGASIDEIRAADPDVICVSPSIQFPLGTVMPAGRRSELIRYAMEKGKIIIEDDYASELRYFGRPVPPLKSLSDRAPVLYLGSFSSLLFPSLKISYMVLPRVMQPYLDKVLAYHTQTCSKTEQLALAAYIEKGLLQTHVKKLRSLYAQKVGRVCALAPEIFGDSVKIRSRESGLNMLMETGPDTDAEELSRKALETGIRMVPLDRYRTRKKDEDLPTLIFYYTDIPLEELRPALVKLARAWGL
ncbi:MAG: PLP-dependent aminotransferase family protein [Firmicutes bacterium]|nr:PLP-dependent aminotransferase family protein [Bacillota bacterium]